ncbi:MAG TPA: PAS domain S-box protein [Rhodocyclaceae bacterium]|nr:PAS domain S-box protein [Rhodocyclaceae bacterium]
MLSLIRRQRSTLVARRPGMAGLFAAAAIAGIVAGAIFFHEMFQGVVAVAVLAVALFLLGGGAMAWLLARRFSDLQRDRREAMEDLRQSQLLLQQGVRIARLGTWSMALNDIHDFSRNPLTWSTEMYRLLGYTPATVPVPSAAAFFARVHPDDLRPLMGAAQRALEDGRPWHQEYRLIRPDGKERVIQESGEVIFDPAGRPIAMVGAQQDITARKLVERRLMESESLFRATFEQAGVGVCHAGVDGHFLRVNDKYCAILGYGRDELLSLRFQDITYPEDVGTNLEGRARLMAGAVKSFGMEKRYVRKDGAVVWTNLSIALVRKPSGEPDYFLSVIEDIQQRKQAEQALAQEREARHAILEQQVEKRTAELQAANRQLEGFVYASSHDLKGPLGRINSFSTLLERKYRDRLEGDGLVFLDFIRDNSTRLTRLIDDLLHHAQIDQQVAELEPVDVQAAVKAALQASAEDIRERGVTLRVDLPAARVLADPWGLSQVLHNLLENALKYSTAMVGPAIEIGGAESAGRFRLWVRDNGIGFDMAYHDKIFEMFRRLHTYSEYAGSGVGLALVKRAMEKMGGRVWAESEPGRGATFFLEFDPA